MKSLAKFILENGQRKLKMRCSICAHILNGPLSRYLMEVRGKKLELICSACRQSFEVEVSDVQYEAEE